MFAAVVLAGRVIWTVYINYSLLVVGSVGLAHLADQRLTMVVVVMVSAVSVVMAVGAVGVGVVVVVLAGHCAGDER